jgi:VanZ family protein
MGGIRPRRTTAWPLAWLYAGLIVYASLYPFDSWRVQGIAPWSFLTAPLPRYWTGFDVVSNVLGYGPLGFLWALTLHRMWPRWPSVWMAVGAAAGLSFTMESLQMFLPMRVPSSVDLVLNVAGAGLGAVLARVLEYWGAMSRWGRFRERWFVSESSGAMALLAVWPVALLFPVAVPFGLGQVYERAETALGHLLEGSPWLEWLPMREVELQPLLPISEILCIAMGLLVPCLLAFSVSRTLRQRGAVTVWWLLTGALACTLSATLTYGPAHAWDWITAEVVKGGVLALAIAVVMWPRSARACQVLALVCLVWSLSLLNQSSADVYFAQTLQTWEQGRFIRFHGLIQWLGWLWPYAVLVHLVACLGKGGSAGGGAVGWGPKIRP